MAYASRLLTNQSIHEITGWPFVAIQGNMAFSPWIMNDPDQRHAPAPKTPAKRERRKDARPGEIIEAAIAIFAERGFAATRMEEVARLAGVSKGTLFVYFATKEELFRAVAQSLLATNLTAMQQIAQAPDMPLRDIVPRVLGQAAGVGKPGCPR
jgi:hypothetical protein